MSLNDILKIEQDRLRRERVIFHEIYNRMKIRINNSVKARAHECIYTIPNFIPGYPLINIEKTMLYLVNKLRKEGFICIPLTSDQIFITWNAEELHKLYELQLQQQQQQRKTVEEKKREKEHTNSSDDFIQSLINSKLSDR